MASGDAVKALRILSERKGWDPTKIEGGGSIANFDVAPDPWKSGVQGVGVLPEGIHDSYPEDHPDVSNPRVTWNAPKRSGSGVPSTTRRSRGFEGGNNAPGEGGADGGSSAPGP